MARINNESGYGLVVECVLAKDETGVRFSLAALFIYTYYVHVKTPVLSGVFTCLDGLLPVFSGILDKAV